MDLLNKIFGVKDVAKEQNKDKNVEVLIEDVLKPPPVDDFWWKDDIFDKTDDRPTIDATKMIIDNIQNTTKKPFT